MKAQISTVVRNPRLLRPYRQIFLLSHMRANTSLLGLIFGANPEIEGYYEMHIGYYSWKSRWRQKLLYFGDHRAKAQGRFMFDKILHNEHRIDPMFLKNPDNRVIFSLRPPHLTVPSLVTLYRRIEPDHELCNPVDAFDYYCARLEKLQELAGLCDAGFCYLDGQALREHSESVLSQLSRWIGLQQELQGEYEIQKKTGERKAGDHSANLKEGRIVAKKTDYSHIELEPARLEHADAVYRAVRERLLQMSELAIC